MIIECVWEHNGDDSLLYASNVVGAFTRGTSKKEAMRKMPQEITDFFCWCGKDAPSTIEIVVTEEKASLLNIADADSDVIFASERAYLSEQEYQHLKALVLQSAQDFYRLYTAFPDKDKSNLPFRKTFYGEVPRTAREMYQHTKNVNAYYFAEIGVEADNEGSIADCRTRGFQLLEKQAGFLTKSVTLGSYGEEWSLRKLLRRFMWHDRIHARAMYRMGISVFGEHSIPNIFSFKAGI